MAEGARGSRRPRSFGEVRAATPKPSGSDLDRIGSGRPRPSRAVLFSITVTGILANTLIAPAIPDILDDLGVSSGQAGFLVAAAALPGVVVAPLIGLLADRFGRREVLIPCLVAFGLFGGLSSFAPNFAALLALRLLQGVGSAGLINLAVVVIADHWTEPDRSRIIGQNSAVLTVSLAVLPPLGGFLTDVGGWRATFVPYWLGLVTAVWAAVELGRSEPREVRITQQVEEALGHLRSATVLAAVGSGMLLFVLVFGLLLTALPLYLDEGFGLGATDRGLVLGLPALTSTVAALSLGRLATRYGARQLILAGSTVMAVSFAVVAGSPGLAMVVAGILFYGFGEGMAIPSLQAIVAGAAPSSSRGAVVAVWVGAVRAGQTIGPIAAGVAVSQVGAPATFLAGAGLAAALLAAQAISGHPADSTDGGH